MKINNLLCTLLLGVSIAAGQSGSSAAPSKQQNPSPSSIQQMTCSELLFLLGDDKQTQDSTYLMMWAYGYKTGISGGDLSKNPLTPEGMKVFVRDLYDQCKINSDSKLLDVLSGKKGK